MMAEPTTNSTKPTNVVGFVRFVQFVVPVGAS